MLSFHPSEVCTGKLHLMAPDDHRLISFRVGCNLGDVETMPHSRHLLTL